VYKTNLSFGIITFDENHLMAYLTSAFNQFFIELAANNNKNWFDENRNHYHKDVKEPFEKFISALIEAVKEYEPTLDMKPGDAIFRINRDIRFAKDKTPYKLNRSALVSKYGRKEAGHPSLYVELGPERIYLAGGAYEPTKEQLEKIREAIAADVKGWRKAIGDKDFVKYFEEVRGEVNKRLSDSELTQAAAEEPMIYMKQFYYQCQLEPEMVTNKNLVQEIMKRYKAAQPVHLFLEEALTRN